MDPDLEQIQDALDVLVPVELTGNEIEAYRAAYEAIGRLTIRMRDLQEKHDKPS